jgi:tRNA(Ile)-lysidine synthase
MPLAPFSLAAIVRRLLPPSASGDLCIALSGGLDSTVLLHALAAAWPAASLRAVHVNHQLQPAAAQWETHCAATVEQLGIKFVSRRVDVSQESPDGPEAAARRARHAAFAQLLRPGEALLTAHHADDQLETVLLALTRGSGLNGLAGMPACQPFAAGWHLRPLLEYTREAIEAWARDRGLSWIADPSNEQRSFSRNFLRHEVIPALRQRWPSIPGTAVRTAAHIAEGAVLLDDLAALDLAGTCMGPCLRVEALARLAPQRRRNLLRYWLRIRGVRLPSTRKLAALEHDMLAAQDDRQPMIEWDGFEVRRFRGLLYVTPALLEFSADAMRWDWQQPLVLAGEMGTLRAERTTGRGLRLADLPQRLDVEFRRSGDSLRPAGHAHRRSLKNLFQEAGVLPWWRERLPMIRIDGVLAAVGDLWVADEFAARHGEEGIDILWDERPQIRTYSPASTN